MTGWRSDPETLEFVDKVEALILSRPDLMPDAWYHISLRVNEREEDELPSDMSNRYDEECIKWLSSHQDILSKKITHLQNLKRIYLETLPLIDQKLEKLNAARNPEN